MRKNNRPQAPLTTANGSRWADVESSRRRNARLISDGVVASYIHDISQRHRYPDEIHGPALEPPMAA
jgi:predicted Zn-dependent protease